MTRVLLLKPASLDDARALAPGRLVVTPNARAARALGVAHVSLETLARAALENTGLAVATPLQADRALKSAIADQKFTDPTGAARTYGRTLRELFRAGIDLDALASAGTSRAALFANLARSYRQALRSQQLLDPAEVLAEAARQGAAPRALLLYGYPRLGLDERAFLNAVAGPDSRVLLPYADHPHYTDNRKAADALAGQGWDLELGAADPSRPFAGHGALPPELQAHTYPNQEAEVRGTLGRIKALIADGADPRAIAIVARDDAAVGPLVLDVAWEYGLPVEAAYRVPLSRTRCGSWVAQLIEAIRQQWRFEPTFRLLGHPLSPALPAEVFQQARERHPHGLAAWRELGVEFAHIAWPKTQPRGSWLASFRQALAHFKVRRQAAHWPADLAAYHRFLAALEAQMAPEDEPLAKGAFLQELQELLDATQTPAHPSKGGVTLHTPLALYGAHFEHVFAIGVAEDHLPARISDDPALDFHERKQLAELGFPVETAAEAARRELLSLGELLRAATRGLTLSCPKLIGDKPAMPSPAFDWLGLTPTAAPPCPVASPQEARRHRLGTADPELAWIHAALQVERRREAACAPGHRDRHDGHIETAIAPDGLVFSATQLTALGQCAFRWLLERGMKLRPLDEAEDELSPSVRGDLYHKTLELGMNAVQHSPDPRAALLDRLEEFFAAAEAAVTIPPLTAWEARRAEHLSRLRRAVQADDFLRGDARTIATEAEFEGVWRGFRVRGLVDRIDATPDGLVLVDYKAGSSVYGKAQDADGNAKLDLQLPIYVEVAAPHLHPGEPVAEAYYYLLGKGAKAAAEPDDAALAALADRLRGHLESGHFPVKPDRKEEACTYCDHALACRRGPRLARKGTLA